MRILSRSDKYSRSFKAAPSPQGMPEGVLTLGAEISLATVNEGPYQVTDERHRPWRVTAFVQGDQADTERYARGQEPFYGCLLVELANRPSAKGYYCAWPKGDRRWYRANGRLVVTEAPDGLYPL